MVFVKRKQGNTSANEVHLLVVAAASAAAVDDVRKVVVASFQSHSLRF